MKKNYIYAGFIILLIAAVVTIIVKYNQTQKEKESKIYTLLPRKGVSESDKEYIDAQNRSNNLLAALKEEPTDVKANLALASLFIQEARVTGNHMYYDVAAMKHINTVLAADTANFNALVFKSLIYLSQHHFAEGLEYANKAKRINPYNAYVYGLMVDANVEMGYYDSAVVNSDRMVSIRPDLTSYSRISYIREIFGDYKGSIEAMKMAVTAGGPGDENTEWSRIQLGQLFEKTGDFAHADTLYQSALNLRPNYPYAIAGLGRVAMAAQDYPKAVLQFEKADGLSSDNSIKEELVEAYRLSGKKEKAEATARQLIENLTKDAEAGNSDDNIGHYSDRELAYAYLNVDETDKALEHAMLEYNRRPENIDVNETVAWVLYKKGDHAKALPYIKTALKTNSQNPILLSRAALIFNKSGDRNMAQNLLQKSSFNNPYVGQALQYEVSAIKM